MGIIRGLQMGVGKTRILDQYLAFGSMTSGVQSTIHGQWYSSISLFTTQTARHQWILFITAPAAWSTMQNRIEE